MAELTAFQIAAVRRIVQRLTDPSSSKRFLLADEVGLGKTMVARGVVEQLQQSNGGCGFTVVYICSNSEIAQQNRDRLCPEKDSYPSTGRLTLLSLESAQIDGRRKQGSLQVFSFTPGTSLQIANSAGIERERRLLMYLATQIWRFRINTRKWRNFFRCGCEPESWETRAKFWQIRRDFVRKISGDFRELLREDWTAATVELVDESSGDKIAGQPLRDCLDQRVGDFDEEDRSSRYNRNRIIGAMRQGLARVALRFLKPDLVILDEFQRFADILLESQAADSIVGRLFEDRGTSRGGAVPILILSATPYRMYTLEHEPENHHDDFFNTYAFLCKEKKQDRHVRELHEILEMFKERLTAGDWMQGTNDELIRLKEQIESRLRKVMCRTERNWYCDGLDKGVKELPAALGAGELPRQPELLEYLELRRMLLHHKIADWNITDFWKSSSAVLSFMDGNYALIRELRHRCRHALEIPERLLCKPDKLAESGEYNFKFRLLLEKLFGCESATSVSASHQPWRYLWVRPTYPYYHDTFYDGNGPRKYLIFSHWRFVPKAIAVVVSQNVERRLGRRPKASSPLQFRPRVALYPFDVCYPSPVLAEVVDQLALAEELGKDEPQQIEERAEQRLRQLLDEARVTVGSGRVGSLWRVVARLESHPRYVKSIAQGFEASERKVSCNKGSDYYRAYAAQYRKWMDDRNSTITISQRWLRRLTQVALYSPAVCLLRTVTSLFADWDQHWDEVLAMCMSSLRSYFNKPVVQAVIRHHGEGIGESYTQHILSYCRKAHFQAVLDEYGYLVRSVLQRHEMGKFLSHLGQAMGMWTGQPLVNCRTRTGGMCKAKDMVPTPSHFALSFGDDATSDETGKDARTRRSEVREAFNSPFWPFVLATTSVGQEGLDFHLYCRDIVHWNLPSNPVDLEQREGRINRFDGLSIRQNIATDRSLGEFMPHVKPAPTKGRANLWERIFAAVASDTGTVQRFKHGLYPHWVYQPHCRRSEPADSAMIRRHLLFYNQSEDVRQYRELKDALSLYRLVLGQPRQKDLLDRVISKLPSGDVAHAGHLLAKYMVNLSPFEQGFALRAAQEEAMRIVAEPVPIRQVIDQVRSLLDSGHGGLPGSLAADVEWLITAIGDDNKTALTRKQRRKALAAILYLVNPYDDVYDVLGEWGLRDDARVVRETVASLTNVSELNQ